VTLIQHKKRFWEELIACFPLIDTDRIENENKRGNKGTQQGDLISHLTKIEGGYTDTQTAR
jgi:hypothetical protein